MSTRADRKRRAAKAQNTDAPQIVWHYTYDEVMSAILDSGELRPPAQVSTAQKMGLSEEEFAHWNQQEGFRADAKLLLFSARQDWEPASYRARIVADRQIPLRRREQYAEWGIRMFRIGVSSAILHPYKQLLRLAHMPHDMAAGLHNLALRIGSNPRNWWGTLKAVPIEQWEAFEYFNPESQTWMDVNTLVPEEQREQAYQA